MGSLDFEILAYEGRLAATGCLGRGTILRIWNIPRTRMADMTAWRSEGEPSRLVQHAPKVISAETSAAARMLSSVARTLASEPLSRDAGGPPRQRQ